MGTNFTIHNANTMAQIHVNNYVGGLNLVCELKQGSTDYRQNEQTLPL